MNDIKWVNQHIEIESPKKTKKITGTRFATILGLNPWSTPFEIWCAVTKTYETPFEDTIYTIAGKTIEPKQAEYMKKSYGMTNLITPTDVFGENYFQKTWGDFYKETPVLGGMWDYQLIDDGKVSAILEMKTTKRVEDWKDDIPEYYALQASLYAYLSNVDDVIMVCSFLEDKDYENPEEFVPNATNTITREFKVSERYPNFQLLVSTVINWWDRYVLSGVSPDYDEKKDAEILKALRTNSLSPDTNILEIIKEAEILKEEIKAIEDNAIDKSKRLKTLTDMIKEFGMANFRDGDKKVELTGEKFVWSVTVTDKEEIDKTAMKTDGVFDKYVTVKPQFRVNVKEK